MSNGLVCARNTFGVFENRDSSLMWIGNALVSSTSLFIWSIVDFQAIVTICLFFDEKVHKSRHFILYFRCHSPCIPYSFLNLWKEIQCVLFWLLIFFLFTFAEQSILNFQFPIFIDNRFRLSLHHAKSIIKVNFFFFYFMFITKSRSWLECLFPYKWVALIFQEIL